MRLRGTYKKYTSQDVSRVVKAATTLLTLQGKAKVKETTFRRGKFFIRLEHQFVLLTPILGLYIYYNNELVFYFKDATDFNYKYDSGWVEELLAYEKELSE